MEQDIVNNLLIFDTSNYLYGTPTMSAGFHIYIEYPFQSLSPGHSRPSFLRIFVIFLITSLPALAPSGWCDQCPVLAVWSEYTVEAGQIDLWFGHQ